MESVAREAGIDNRHSRRFARVELDLERLLRPSAPIKDGVVPTEVGPLAQSTVTIEPFPGEVYQVNGRYVEEWTDSAWSWVGAIEGYESADFVVSVTETGYFGMMRVGPIVYEIRPGSDGSTYIREPDIAAYELESACAHGINAHEGEKAAAAFDPGVEPKDPHASAPASKSSGGTAVIDILLLYTANAAANYDIEALANSSIAWMNISFDDSDVDAVGRIVHYEPSEYQEQSDGYYGNEVIQLAQSMRSTWPGNVFEEVTQLRNLHSADLALLLWDGTSAGDTCGAGLAPNSPSGNAQWMWTSNTGDSCIAMFNNFTHEIGHNLGIGHDYPGDPNYTAYSYGNGYSAPGSGTSVDFRTIMGSVSCALASCDRINLWSDPSKTYQGQPRGIPNQSDAVQALATMSSVISGYRTPTGSPPGSMSNVSIIRGLCFGNNWVNYSSPSGLVGWYEIETDSNSSFSSPTLFYRGVKESVPLNVSSTTWVRARACNSVSCNSWKNGNQTATYTSGCI